MAIIKINNNAIDLDAAEIPNLDAAKITTGQFADAKIADVASSKITGTITPSDATVSIAKLTATGTQDATTFLRGDNTFAEAGGGKILQVLSTAKTNTFSSTSTSYTDITGYSVAITPSSTSSKIFIQGFLSVSVNAWSTYGAFFQLVRGSTNILTSSGSSANGSFSYSHEASSEIASKKGMSPAGFCFLDSPSSTSEITYKVQGKTTSGSNGEFYINYNGNGGTNYTTTSVITVMEVSG